MDPERWRRLRELFDGALGLSAADRSAFLDRECAGDPELRSTLDSLLEHTVETGLSLEQALLEVIDLEQAVATELMLVGRRLGHYQILEKIGRGGMGEVFLALDTRLGRQVAIKILPDHFSHDQERMARFEREARVLASLSHPNIATIHGLEVHEGVHFLVLELIEGNTLRDRLAAGPLPAPEGLDIAAQIAEGLAKAHQAGIVHRDLKPDNLMLTSDGFVKILDFGLAKEIVEPGRQDSMLPTEPALETALGRVMGTSAYMSPEQARGDPIDHRSDQFAFGAVLYEIATGHRAFTGETAADTLVAIMRQEPDRAADYDDRVPGALRTIIERCLAKDPAERFESTSDLARELRQLSKGGVTTAAEETAEEPSAPQRLLSSQWVGALLLFAALAAAGLIWWHSRDKNSGDFAAQSPGSGSAAVESRRPAEPASTREPSASIAVLPLENLGPADEAYFADGMTDALITHLARIEALKVISRISVMQYRDTRQPLSEIAAELGVETLLVGSVLHGGDRVRISTQLIDAASDRNLWADSYESDLTDILSLQSQVAQQVARAVQVETRPEEEVRIAASRSVDPVAYEAYLRGLESQLGSYHGGPSDDELRASIYHLERAIELEPDWAEPWAKMANAQHWIASRGGVEIQAEFYPKAKASALRAIELDETVAQGHASLGFVLVNHEWDWVGALKAYQRAIELDPNLTSWYYGMFLKDAGYYDEAVVWLERALERYPTSAGLRAQLGRVYLCAGRPADAEAAATDLISEYPESPLGDLLLARVYMTSGRFEEAVATLRRWRDSGFGPLGRSWMSRALAYAQAKAGEIEQAQAILRELEDSGFSWMPGLYLALGQEDKAVAQFEAAFAARRDALLQIRCNPEWELEREVPRIREIAEAIGFPAGEI